MASDLRKLAPRKAAIKICFILSLRKFNAPKVLSPRHLSHHHSHEIFPSSFNLLLLWSPQISLATRDKTQTPPIYYPPVHIHRPASASLSHHRNRLTSRNSSNLCHNRRPLSADSRFINTKANSSVKFNLGNVSLNFFAAAVAASASFSFSPFVSGSSALIEFFVEHF